MYSKVILLLMMFSTISSSEVQSSSPVIDLLTKALIKTFQTAMNSTDLISKLTIDNDEFNLDDALHLFLLQYIHSLIDGPIELLPNDWNERYPYYAKVVDEINHILGLLRKRRLSQISMKDIRPFVESLTSNAFIDLQHLINDIKNEAEKNSNKEEL